MDTQLKKGVLEMCVLIRLSRKDMYGYEIMKIIQSVFPEVYDGSIYTILHRIWENLRCAVDHHFPGLKLISMA